MSTDTVTDKIICKTIDNTILNTVNKISEKSEKNTKFTGIRFSVIQAVEYLQIGMFPNYAGKDFSTCRSCIRQNKCTLTHEKEHRILAFQSASEKLLKALLCIMKKKNAEQIIAKLIEKIPNIKEQLNTDIQAAYEGDPAALNKDEIILAYPAFRAISVYRIAHELYEMKVPIIPRIMTEYAHEKTGIDINPGAKIGSYFFIDHGTGVVIGETAVIGSHVKIYQNVTLGAKSFPLSEDGTPIKGIKRHPKIGNNVIIYAGATILGGNTVIEDNCVIGGNVWLTESVPSGKTITQKTI